MAFKKTINSQAEVVPATAEALVVTGELETSIQGFRRVGHIYLGGIA